MAFIMMRALLRHFLVVSLLAAVITGLQVTPNSPCSSLCLDSSDSNASDPRSSNTNDSDIMCSDKDYASDKGKKFEGCMNCLQNSTYSQGSENDQTWFVYNLRYAFHYCVFGSGIGSYPCVTSEACGPLKDTISRDLVNNTGTDAFGYCNYHGGSTLGSTFTNCLSCMGSDTQHGYIANYLVALEAGCEQRPTAQGHIALNDTLFTSHVIGIVNTTAAAHQSSPAGSPAVIAGAVVGSVVAILLVALCVFFLVRRRTNRRNRSALEHAAARHMRGASSMDFQCATHVNPFSPGFRNSNDGWDDPHHAMEVQMATAVMIRPGTGEKIPIQHQQPYQDQEQREGAAFEKETFADAVDALNSHPPTGPVRNFSRKDKSEQGPAYIDTTAAGIARPEPAMTSPMPYSPDSYVTPSSTTSATPFLAGWHSGFSPQSPNITYSARMGSPLVHQASWEDTKPQGRSGLLRSKASKTDVSAPVASRQLQTSFPPPPKR